MNGHKVGAHTKHIKKEVKKEIYPCEYCEFETDYKNSLKRHTETKHKQRGKVKEMFQCQYCELVSDYKQNVIRHALTVHKDLGLSPESAQPIKVKRLIGNGNENEPKPRIIVTRNRKRRQKCTEESEDIIALDSPPKKRQRRVSPSVYVHVHSSDKRTCDECGKVCKTLSGLGTHKFHGHGTKGKSDKTQQRRRIKLKITKQKRKETVAMDRRSVKNSDSVPVSFADKKENKKCISKAREIITID